MPYRLSQERIDREFGFLREADAGSLPEVIVRLTLILTVSVALCYATQSPLFPVWAVTYALIAVIYTYGLRSITGPVSAGRMFFFLGVSAFLALFFGLGVIYIATVADGHLNTLALCGCCGLAMHAMTRSAGRCLVAYSDLTATIVTALTVFAIIALQLPEFWQSMAVAIGGIGVSVYFTFSYFQIIALRSDLQERLAIETQTEKMRALGQLSSGVAHDFNNLLTIIGGNIQLAQLDPATARRDAYLGEAQLAADRGAALIRNLLAFAHKSKVHVVRSDAREILARVDTLLSRALPAHVQLEVIALNRSAVLDVDVSMLENALLNLAINARDALGKDPGLITVKAIIDTAPEWLLITVTDSGPGMDPKTLRDATEPFFTTKQVGQGSGLGLSMVKGFTEQSGGTFTISNRPEGGLCAALRLPLVRWGPMSGV